MFRRRKQLEANHDPEADAFAIHDPNLKTWSSIPFGDVIIDITKKGQICAVEVLNVSQLNFDLHEHEKIWEMLEREEKKSKKADRS